jgi:tetratricopeptide (TPR) repeat protein
MNDYECWNIDKLEGLGNGLTSVNATGYRLVEAYMGEFTEELPGHYFDFIFSISALEHVGDDKKTFQNICLDIDRVLKPGDYSLHCFDVVLKKDEVWTNQLLPHMFENFETINSFIPLDQLKYDDDLFVMSKQAYIRRWQHITKKPYEEFGEPVSYNILWKKKEIEEFRLELTNQRYMQSNITSQYVLNNKTVNDELRNNLIKINKSNFPKITIVTHSYNQGEFLEECIDSILSQNYPNLEFIIMDGGSTDGSVDIIKKYEKHLAYWQSNPDQGQYDAINEGFARSTGQIMAWLNSDDKYHEDSLFKTAYIFNQYPSVEWITGRPTAWKENGDLAWVFDPLPVWKRETYLKEALKEYYIQQESTFWRATLWQKAGARLRTDLKLAGDMELWVRFFRYAKLYTVDTLIGGYRHQPNQKTKQNMEKYVEETQQIFSAEIANIQKGKFSSMLPAASLILLEESDICEYKQGILPNHETADVAAGGKDRSARTNLKPQNETSASSDAPQIYPGTGYDSAITIATSLAPKEIELQNQAIKSWRNLGFDVVSINSQAEIDLLKEFFPEVQFIKAHRNAKMKFGKPYVYFDDFLKYFSSIDSEICGIVNADIHLIQDKGIVPYILAEANNSLVYGSRIEIESLNDLSGKFYDGGFDFFFFDKSILSCYPSSETYIGVTWWDFWAPLIPALEGVPIKKLVSPFAYHISHPYRWDKKQWIHMGKHISDYLYSQRYKINSNQSPNSPWALFDAIHSNATHIYFIDRDLDPEEKVKKSYQKIRHVAVSITTFLKKISVSLQYNGLPESLNPTIQGQDEKVYDLNGRGEILLKKDDFKGALKCFLQTLEIDPNFAKTHTNAGIIYWNTGDIKKALQHFQIALANDQSDRIATLYWTKFLINNNQNRIGRLSLAVYLRRSPGDLEVGKILNRFEKGDDVSQDLTLELNYSLKEKAVKYSNINNHNSTYNIDSEMQNTGILPGCEKGDVIQSPSRLNAAHRINCTDSASIKIPKFRLNHVRDPKPF